jgi:hypothetical protein
MDQVQVLMGHKNTYSCIALIPDGSNHKNWQPAAQEPETS